MITQQLTVNTQSGLHARPAALFVQTARGFECKIRIKKEEQETDAKSILGVIGLAVNKGTAIILTAEGPDEAKAMEVLAKLVAGNFGEGA